MTPTNDGSHTRSVCVVAGASPEQVAALGEDDRVGFRRNARGTLVTGDIGSLPIEYSVALPGPVYDVFYSEHTGWFAVTVYSGASAPLRWDNRPGDDAGYARVDHILGASTPTAILAALDIPLELIGYPRA